MNGSRGPQALRFARFISGDGAPETKSGLSSLGRQALPKAERLCGKKNIATLVSCGKWGSTEHLKYCYHSNSVGVNRVMVAVPKRFFKRAVKRNLLKRRIREAYRTQKMLLFPPSPLSGRGTDVLIQYNSGEIVDYAIVRAEVAAALASVSSKMSM